MKKRIISAALATLMAVSALGTSAFAAGPKADGTLEATGTVNVPTLEVTVPTEAGFIVNPYKLSVTVGESDKTDTIIATYGADKTSWDIENASKVVKVKGSMYAIYKAAKTVQVNATGDAVDATKKQMSLTLKVKDTAEKDVTLLETAPAAWTKEDGTAETGVTTFELAKATDSANGKASLTLTGTATATEGLAWTESDTVTISMVFKFDILANA